VSTTGTTNSGSSVGLFLAWLWVGIPLAWGVWVTLVNVTKLFTATTTT